MIEKEKVAYCNRDIREMRRGKRKSIRNDGCKRACKADGMQGY